jgi:hypothetical protein
MMYGMNGMQMDGVMWYCSSPYSPHLLLLNLFTHCL